MRLLLTRRLPDLVINAAADRFEVVLRDRTEALTDGELRTSLRDFDLILPTLGDRYSAAVFADVPAPRVRLLANFGVGFNHIDIAAARLAGIAVTNTPGAVTDATADIAVALILMTGRRLGEGERLVRAGLWKGWHPTQMLGTHVSRKRIGIIGMGRIGKAIARRCHFGFGMEVVFHNRSPVADPGVPARQVPMDEAMGADFVVVAVPASPATHHLINAKTLENMKKSGILINIARGDIVDETALIVALKERRIGGAGVDVYEFEPEVPAELRGLENVVLLPHLGTACLEVREAMGMMAVENLIAFSEGKAPPNLLN
jgi:gluconate 2-dehydrogenase